MPSEMSVDAAAPRGEILRPGSAWLLQAGLAIGVLWVAALAYYLSRPYLSHDVSWVLLATDRLLDGARVYRDIIEINPPLLFYSAVPPVAVARLTGWPAGQLFVVYVLVLAAASLLLAGTVMKRTAAIAPRHRPYMLAAGFVALVILPVSDFGQREHLTTILVLPYVVLAAARMAGRDCSIGVAILAGAVAGIGFAMKPYFCIVPALLALYLAAQQRSLRALFLPEAIGAGLVVALYAAVIVVAHPEYIDVIVPYARLVYGAYERSTPEVVAFAASRLLPFAIYAAARAGGRAAPSLDAFAITAGGFFLAYLVQSKGWTYHLVPVDGFLWMCMAGLAIGLVSNPAAGSMRARAVYSAVAIAILACSLGGASMRGAYRNDFTDRLAPIVRSLAPTGSLYAFSSHVWVPFPLVTAADVGWASRFPTQWLTPGLVNRLREPAALDPASAEGLEQVRRFVIDAVLQDLQQGRPEIVLVDLANPYFDEPFDYLEFFGRDPRFRTFWRDYVRVDQVSMTRGGVARAFDIYCRRGSTPACAR